MSNIASTLMTGAGAGLSIAVPFGPMSLLCVERTLSAGLPAGMATGLGVATVHVTYSTLAVLGGVAFMATTSGNTIMTLASALVLLFFAWRIWHRKFDSGVRSSAPTNLLGAYCGAVSIGFLNPLTPALCAAALTAFVHGLSAPGGLLIAGVFAGSIVWWMTLSTIVSLLRKRLDARTLTWANRMAGCFLGLLAFSLVLRGLSGLVQFPS